MKQLSEIWEHKISESLTSINPLKLIGSQTRPLQLLSSTSNSEFETKYNKILVTNFEL